MTSEKILTNGIFGKKIIDKIYKEIDDKMKTVELHTFMSATHAFGRGVGERKLREILRKYPNIINEKMSKKELTDKIMEVDGFSEIMTAKFVDNLEEFKNFCVELNKVYDINHIIKKKKEENENPSRRKQPSVTRGCQSKARCCRQGRNSGICI